jgi:hypothetical protein
MGYRTPKQWANGEVPQLHGNNRQVPNGNIAIITVFISILLQNDNLDFPTLLWQRDFQSSEDTQ